MASYFRNVPNFEYVNRLPGSYTSSEYIEVKNLFKRGKIKDDIFKDITYFTKYSIIGDERPDNVASKVYNDSTLDWIVLLSNNMVNVQTEWPLTQQSFDVYLTNKYGSFENIYSIHHYETKEIKNSINATILPEGLQVYDKDYTFEFLDANLEKYTVVGGAGNPITTEVTNYDYEVKLQDEKRDIYLLKAIYLPIVLDDMNEIMPYKEGSTQYVSETLVRGQNIKLYS